MSLIERFIAVQQWPTSRRVALLCALILPPTAFNWAMAKVLWSRLDWVDMAYFDKSGGGMVAVEIVVGALAWEVGRRGHEGTWTFYLLAATFLPFLAMLIWGFGLFSSALLIFVPLTLLNVLVLFNGREGLVALALATVWVSAGVVLALTEWIPYAPGLVAGQETHFDDWKYILSMGSISIGSTAVIFLVAFAEVTAARQTSARLAAAHKIIARYVPAAVAEDILGGKHDDGHHRRKLTVFFSDLVGFSDIAEELEPEDLAMVLNEYFGEMTAIAHKHHGTVDELQGDALLILFGAPRATTDKEHALNAVRMAAEMHEAMAALNARWRKAGINRDPARADGDQYRRGHGRKLRQRGSDEVRRPRKARERRRAAAGDR